MGSDAHPDTFRNAEVPEGGRARPSDRFGVSDSGLLLDGRRISASPSAQVLAIALRNEGGRIVSYDDLAIVMGSRSADPANVVKVHVHDLRSCTEGLIPIVTHPGIGLSWGAPDDDRVRNDPEVTFERTSMRVDGRSIRLTPLACRITHFLWLRQERSHAAGDILRAIGSKSKDPGNVLKVSMHGVKRAFMRIGLSSPVRSVRGSGTRWTGVSSLSEHDVGQTDSYGAGDQQPPG
jgi:DNA-binding response OmpR family regulator